MNHENHRVVTLKHLLIKNEKQIGMKFYPNKMVQTVIKGLPHVKWSSEFGMAYIENNPKNMSVIFSDFRGIAWINGSHFFNKKTNAKGVEPISVDSYRKRKLPENYRECPEVFLQKLELKHYALNTAKTYIQLFEVFINHYKNIALTEIDEGMIRLYIQNLVHQQNRLPI